MNTFTQTIDGQRFTVSFLKFSGLCGSQSIIVDRPQYPKGVLSTDPSMATACTHCGKKHPAYCEGTVGTPITVAFQTAGDTKWEIGLDAVSDDFVLAYTPTLGDILRTERKTGKFVLGPGVDTASQETAQLSVRTSLPIGFEILSHAKILPKNAIRFNAGDKQCDGLALDKNADVGRNWLRFNQGSGVHDWRVGMDAEYSLTFRTGKGQDTSAEKPGNVALELTAQGEVKLPELAYSVAGTPLVLDSNGCVRKQAPTDHEARIKQLEAAIAVLIARLDTE